MRLHPTLLLLALPLFLGAQDPALREALATGKALWAQQGDREGAAVRLDQVLAALSPTADKLSQDWLRVLCEAHGWMAILEDRVPARRPLALKHLEQLVELDPGFDIDRTVTNTRLQAAFDGLRNTRLAKVSLTLAPEGGTLEMDGRVVSAAPGFRHLKPGAHALTYHKPGFRSQTQSMELQAKEQKTIALALERVASTLTLAVCPADATLTLDGRAVGQPSSGGAPGESADPSSRDYVVDGITAGEHFLEVSAPCHRTRRLRIPPEMGTPFADHILEAVRLEKAEGRLTLASLAPGGSAFLSGRALGPLPLKELPVCAGRYDLRVDYPAGGFSQRVEVPDGGTLTVEARPKARLALLGLAGAQDFAGKERLLTHFQRLPELLKEVAIVPGVSPSEAPADALARLRMAKGAELLCYLSVTSGRVEVVLTTLTGEESRWAVNPLDPDPLAGLATRLNALPETTIRDAGLRLVDTPSGPLVLEASEGAQAAGIRALALLTAAGGKPVPSVAAFRAALAAAGPTLAVEQEGKTLELPVIPQSLELPLHDEGFAYPLLLADFQLRRLGTTPMEGGILAFHQAQVLMHFRRFDKALEVLRETRMTTTEGVSQGTLAYYEGLCLLRLGQVFLPDARQAFTRASTFPKATLFGPDGPLVAPLARQILDDIKP